MATLLEFFKVTSFAATGITAFVRVCRNIIAKKIFPQLTPEQAYKIVKNIIHYTGSIAILAIICWTFLVWCEKPPASSAPAPSAPAPSVPAPSAPAPSVPAPSAPAPSVPAPSAPAPSVPSVPAPSAPAPVWESKDVVGKDTSTGKSAHFKIAIITQEHRWVFKSTTNVEDGDQNEAGVKVDEVLPPFLSQLPNFQNALGITVVGVASEEGEPTKEEARADKRADNVLKLLRKVAISNGKELYKLNLGRHKSTGTALTPYQTSSQRRLIVVGIMRQDPEMNFAALKAAFYNALQQPIGLAVPLSEYAQFKFIPYGKNE
jgi:hypothetical protein